MRIEDFEDETEALVMLDNIKDQVAKDQNKKKQSKQPQKAKLIGGPESALNQKRPKTQLSAAQMNAPSIVQSQITKNKSKKKDKSPMIN